MAFSVIIPTLFRRIDILKELLNSLYEDTAVEEIILIDNTEYIEEFPNLEFHDKLNVYSSGTNLYVNPSWNYGVELAKNDKIAILNDDIVIADNLFNSLEQVPLEGNGIVGLAQTYIIQQQDPRRFIASEFSIGESRYRNWGYGVFMIMHKQSYVKIPDDLMIWCGDDYLYDQNILAGRKNYTMLLPVITKMSSTSDDPIFDDIKNNDLHLYKTKYKI